MFRGEGFVLIGMTAGLFGGAYVGDVYQLNMGCSWLVGGAVGFVLGIIIMGLVEGK